MNRILVLAAHLLDETFAEFGALSEHVKGGDAVSIVMFSDYLTAAGMLASGSAIIQNHQRVRIGCKNMVGTDDIWMHRYMPGNMPRSQVAQHIGVHINRFRPTQIWIHSGGGGNPDHLLLREALADVGQGGSPGLTLLLIHDSCCAKECA